jgi:outer membrane receptor protein involved in Fe transport
MIVGADLRHTESAQDEFRFALVTGVNTRSGPFVSGGTENVAAAYARANVAVTDALTVEVGARADSWKSDPLNPQQNSKDVTYISPRAAVSARVGRVQLQASGYYANRTPSLNELHRQFAVGSATTLANPELDPETLTGVEGGVLTQFSRASFRATAFVNNLEQAISNITLSQVGAVITRQRQNADKIDAKGVELEIDGRFTNTLSASGQIVFTASHYRASKRTSETPALIDKTVPQVPKVQGGLALTWTDPRWFTAATQLRFSGEQFDDDLNTADFVLKPYAVWDATASRAIVRGLNAYLAVENILDTEYDTARTPLRSVGWPRTLRVGARVTWQ